jgi:hypothetical protein
VDKEDLDYLQLLDLAEEDDMMEYFDLLNGVGCLRDERWGKKDKSLKKYLQSSRENMKV